ncbi:MAG: type II toxin-antitoxin system VapB family antitoxin [Zoogloeaceae bacterium]|jgi:hypothetical protein|nr:type II toxin-antitoxin system VapB family antitoxin [Zoogloeaceae bacterium]
MTITIEDAQMERLAERIAVANGVSVAEILREGLLSLAGTQGQAPREAPLRARLAQLAREVDAIPPCAPPDTRSDDEVLGYDEHGTAHGARGYICTSPCS